MNLSHEERILIKDIFNVKVVKDEPGDLILLQHFPQQIATLGPNVSLIKNNTYFDSLLMERLQIPNTDILYYLEDCLIKANYIKEKPWNQNDLAQQFINYSKEIINNFIYLSQIEYDIFPEQIHIDTDSINAPDQTIGIAKRLMTHFQRNGYNDLILDAIYPKINEDLNGNFAEAFLEVLIARARFQTIIDSKAYFYLTVFQELMGRADFKKTFLTLSKCPLIPAEPAKLLGSMIDQQSPLGILFKYSILGTLPGYFHQQVQASKKYEEKTMTEFGKQKFGKDKMKYYTDLQNQFYTKCTEVFKLLLKKDSQKKFFDWCYTVLLSNLSRTKLGNKLATAKLNTVSHDGFMMNLYMGFLNLCKPILSIEGQKYKNINPQYYLYNDRIKLCKYEPLNKENPPQMQKKEVEFGTITEFFFLTFEFLHVGLIPTFQNFIQNYEAKERLEKMKDKYDQPGNPYASKFKYQLQRLNTKNILFYIALLDQNLINPTIKLFNILLYMFPKWFNIDYEDLVDCKFQHKYKIPKIAYYFPQHILDSIYKFHFEVYKFKGNYMTLLGENHIHNLLNITCLVLSDQNISSNPYIGANFVELLFFFVYEHKTGIMYEVFKSNPVAHRNLAFSLIKFYSDIAVAGGANQFYEKFKYRQYVNKIFTSIWAHEVYRQNMKMYFKTGPFEKFLNMVMSDTTYCFDETNQKYDTYKGLQRKAQQGSLNEEDKKNYEQLSGQIQATLNHSTSNLRLIKELSKWCPETFFSEAFLSDIVMLLNNILKTFMQPTTFVSNRQLLLKYKFEKETVLSNIVQTYVNLHVSERFPLEIVKDSRFFQKQYFSKALQKASNEHQTDIETLQKFEALINALQSSKNEEEDDDEIFGEIPEKYLCSLMSTLMKDPVKLPSGYVVDRMYIHKHVLNDERDPFTRQSLKNNAWTEMKDLKDQIAVWKKKRLAELKGANKQVKYGNIGKNTKQEQNDSLYDAKKVNYEGEEDEHMMQQES